MVSIILLMMIFTLKYISIVAMENPTQCWQASRVVIEGQQRPNSETLPSCSKLSRCHLSDTTSCSVLETGLGPHISLVILPFSKWESQRDMREKRPQYFHPTWQPLCTARISDYRSEKAVVFNMSHCIYRQKAEMSVSAQLALSFSF